MTTYLMVVHRRREFGLVGEFPVGAIPEKCDQVKSLFFNRILKGSKLSQTANERCCTVSVDAVVVDARVTQRGPSRGGHYLAEVIN